MKKTVIILIIAFLSACGSGESKKAEEPLSKSATLAQKYKLTEFQLENGIGPETTEIKLSAINGSDAALGKDIYDMKCAACHKADDRFVGPSMRYVTERRTTAYIVNMILNPDEMINKHPLARKMLAQYMNKMTFQNVKRNEALQIVEYFRTLAKEGKEKNIPEKEKFPKIEDLK